MYRIKVITEESKVLRQVAESAHLIDSILPSRDDESFVCLRFIDPYGDTIFNPLQIKTFLAEWDRISKKVTEPQKRQFLEEVRRMAEMVGAGTHIYLKFEGD